MAVLDRSRKITRQVVVKEDDLLTPAEVKQQYPEVQKAMLKELTTWANLKCFSRKPKKDAKNIIDVRWVHKRKWEKPKSDGKTVKTDGDSAGHWTIRSRLTVRGFKDQQKEDIARYAGTSTRSSQRVLVSESVRNRWPIGTLDISVAFLKGVTYRELAEMTGEPMREVNFYLPDSCIPLLAF